MDKVKEMAEDIFEELDGAKHYLEKSVFLREHCADISRQYHEMAKQEISHADKLYQIGKRMIDEAAHDHDCADVWQWVFELIEEKRVRLNAIELELNR